MTAMIKDGKVELRLDRVNGGDTAIYKQFLFGLKVRDDDTWQSFLRREVVARAMPGINPSDDTTLDLFASAVSMFLYNRDTKGGPLQLMDILESGMEGGPRDRGTSWLTSPTSMSLYKRVRTGQNIIHMVLNPAFVYEQWNNIPAAVRNGLPGREQYKEAHRRQGGSDLSIGAFVPRPIVGAEPSTGANRAASGNIVPAGPNASVVAGVSNEDVGVVSVVAAVSNQDGDDMAPAAASASGHEEEGSCSVM